MKNLTERQVLNLRIYFRKQREKATKLRNGVLSGRKVFYLKDFITVSLSKKRAVKKFVKFFLSLNNQQLKEVLEMLMSKEQADYLIKNNIINQHIERNLTDFFNKEIKELPDAENRIEKWYKDKIKRNIKYFSDDKFIIID